MHARIYATPQDRNQGRGCQRCSGKGSRRRELGRRSEGGMAIGHSAGSTLGVRMNIGYSAAYTFEVRMRVAAGVIFARVVAAGVFSFLCRRCSVYFFRRRSLFWHPCRRCFLRVNAAGEVVISIRAAGTLCHTSRSQFSESRSRRFSRASHSQ